MASHRFAGVCRPVSAASRGNIVATVRSSDVSDVSGKPDDLDDSDAGGHI